MSGWEAPGGNVRPTISELGTHDWVQLKPSRDT